MKKLTARQQEIIEAAIRLIDEGGIQNVTMKNIADRIGISEPALYRHFKNKMDILLSMLGQFRQRSEFQLKRAHFFDTSGMILLETIFMEHAGQFAENPHLAAVVFSEESFRGDTRLAEEVHDIMKLAQQALEDIIERAQEREEIRHDVAKEHLALMVLGTLRLMVKRWRMTAHSYDLKIESSLVWGALKTLMALPSA